MSKIKLTGENSGYVEISAGQNAGNNTLETPTSGTRLVAHEGSQDVTLNANLTVNGVLTYDDVTNIDSVGVITARAGVNVTGGSVGIGTDAPTAGNKLHLHDTSACRIQLTTDSTGHTLSDGTRLMVDSSNNFEILNRENANIEFFTNNTERLRVTSDGKIGVNNTSPLSDLQVITAGQTEDGTFRIGGSVASLGLVLDYDQSGATVSKITANPTYTNNSSLLKMCVDGDTNPDQLVLKGDGNIGIGTDNPSNLLHVQGQSRFEDYLRGNSTHNKLYILDDVAISATKKLYFDGGSNTYIDEVSGDTLRFATAGTERFRIDANGSAQFTGSGRPSGRDTRISRYASLLVGYNTSQSGELVSNPRCSIDAGNGNIRTEGYVAGGIAGSVTPGGKLHIRAADECNFVVREESTSLVLSAETNSGRDNNRLMTLEGAGLVLNSGGTERLRIAANGTTTIGPQYDRVTIEPGNGTYDGEATTLTVDGRTNDGNRVALKVDRYDSGTSATTKFSVKYDGAIFSTSGMQAASVNLQSSSTASWFQTGANYGGADYVWAAKNTQTNTWHSGLKTTGDLYLGGNITATRNISLNGSNGSAHFTGQLVASPFYITAGSSSYVKSIYGAVSNSTVSSLNNLLIGQNMRGYLNSDGVSTNNNFYSIQNYNAGQMGHAGTEYCYGGITKFYNDTNASTANATFTPVETARIDTSGSIYVANSFRISTTSGGTSLPNPYSLGALASATIPSYQHITGIWVVLGSVPCNNTWYDLLHSFSDSNGMFHGYCGDASSKNIYQYQYSMTSPAYGVNNLSQRFMNGAWNTGSVSFQIRNNSGAWTLQIKATSHYNSSNNAGFRIMFHSYY